ncbi:MAG: FAD-dependent oxidoreductase [Pseudomonadota bacterium]
MADNAKGMSRRAFTAAAGSIALLAGAAPRRSWAADKQADVIVIGGGMAGLSAALTLEDSGLKVLIVEADNRLGGRCFTLRTQDGSFDCGATTIGPLYGRVRAFADQAGVALKAPPGRDKFSYHINGGFVHPSAWEGSAYNKTQGAERAMLPERLEFPTVLRHNKIDDILEWASAESLRYDVPLDIFLSQNGVSDEAIRLIGLTSNVMSLSETSALFQMREFVRLALPQSGDRKREVYAAGKDGQYHYVKNGTSALIDGMAGLLKAEPMLNAPVKAIDVSDGTAAVTLLDGKVLRAGSVICTAPFSALRNIDIRPLPEAKKRVAIQTAAYTLTTHVFFVPTKPYWEADGHPAGLISDDVVERVMANYDDNGNVTWIDVWLNGTAAETADKMSEADRIAMVQSRLETLRPSMKGAIRPVGSYSWGNKPYIQGNKYVMRPGEAASLFPYLAEPHAGRLFFAGEHTRNHEAGLEAAAATGIREAVNVLERFG